MDSLYEPGDSFYICAYHDRNKRYWSQSHLTYDRSRVPKPPISLMSAARSIDRVLLSSRDLDLPA